MGALWHVLQHVSTMVKRLMDILASTGGLVLDVAAADREGGLGTGVRHDEHPEIHQRDVVVAVCKRSKQEGLAISRRNHQAVAILERQLAASTQGVLAGVQHDTVMQRNAANAAGAVPRLHQAPQQRSFIPVGWKVYG